MGCRHAILVHSVRRSGEIAAADLRRVGVGIGLCEHRLIRLQPPPIRKHNVVALQALAADTWWAPTCICTSVASLLRKLEKCLVTDELSLAPCSEAMRRMLASVLAKYGRRHQLAKMNSKKAVPSGAANNLTVGSAVPLHLPQ